MTKKVKWFARGGGIAQMGPFDTQIAATNAMRLVKRPARTRIAHDGCLVHEPEQRQEFPPDVFVWPEEV